MEALYERFRVLLERTNTEFLRYLHHKIDWNNRLTAIVGARGVGKTTLLLQHIKLNLRIEETLYVSADDLYFTNNSLFDLASTFYKNGGKFFFIDEVHKYDNWSKEIKMMYDYYPDMNLVFTGSSILDIYKGSDDLSRRALMYHLYGMSFREYLNMSQGLNLKSYSLDEIVNNKIEISSFIQHPLPLFKKYLSEGYYPFYKESAYQERLRNILNLIIETDIQSHINMNVSSAKKMKQLLYIISQSVPFKPNFTKIAEMIGVHRNQIVDFLYYMERAGIILQLRTHTKGIRLLGKVEKIYLANSNLIYAIGENVPDIGNIRETFFLNQINVNHIVFSSDVADFSVDDYIFEVGGKNKNRKQIEGLTNAFIVKDDIEFGYAGTIPLWAFGFNY